MLLSLALSLAAKDSDPRLPIELLTQSGVEDYWIFRSKDNAAKRYVSFTAKSSGRVRCKIDVYWSGVDNPSGTFRDSPIEPPATYSGESTFGPSGLRIGSDSIFSQGQISVTWLAITKHEYVQVGIFQRAKQDGKGFLAKSPRDWTEDSMLLERLTRNTLALTAGMRLEDFRTRNVAGHAVASGTCDRTDRMFGGLSEWCQKEGWTIETNSDVGYYTLRKGASYAVFPLGSVDVKINGVWKSAGDAVSLRDGRVYVTETALNLLGSI